MTMRAPWGGAMGVAVRFSTAIVGNYMVWLCRMFTRLGASVWGGVDGLDDSTHILDVPRSVVRVFAVFW